MPSIGFTCDVEILVGVFGEGLEEQGKEGIDVFAGGDGVGDGRAAVGKAGIDGLIEEDDASVGVPAVGVLDDVEIFINERGTKFEEEPGEGGAAWSAVDPEDHRIVLGVVT